MTAVGGGGNSLNGFQDVRTEHQKARYMTVRSMRVRCTFEMVIDSGLGGSTGGVPREQKMLKGHLPRVIYHQGRAPPTDLEGPCSHADPHRGGWRGKPQVKTLLRCSWRKNCHEETADGLEAQVHGYLAHKDYPSPQAHQRSLGTGLLKGPMGGGGHVSEEPL